MKIFVYGTLKADFYAHSLMEGSKFIGPAITHSRYRLYNMGSFPGVVEDGSFGSGVIGELYEVPDHVLIGLDRYECISTGLFRREEIELSDGTLAFAYLYNRNYKSGTIVESGEWVE